MGVDDAQGIKRTWAEVTPNSCPKGEPQQMGDPVASAQSPYEVDNSTTSIFTGKELREVK